MRLAGALPQVNQGLREPDVQRARLPQIGLDPPHAAKALFKMNNFVDRLLMDSSRIAMFDPSVANARNCGRQTDI
jgi:hypothetical protein